MLWCKGLEKKLLINDYQNLALFGKNTKVAGSAKPIFFLENLKIQHV